MERPKKEKNQASRDDEARIFQGLFQKNSTALAAGRGERNVQIVDGEAREAGAGIPRDRHASGEFAGT
jgi:hypothetical protein